VVLDRLSRPLVVVMCLLLAVAFASCASSPSASSSSSLTPSTAAKVAARITARTLYVAFTADKASANKLYKGKLLEVTGAVSRVDTDPILNAPEVMLIAGGSTQGPGVDCILEPQYARQVSALRQGQTVAVQGTCDGYAVNVLLLHCQLVSGTR
jgi:hypothetical protein